MVENGLNWLTGPISRMSCLFKNETRCVLINPRFQGTRGNISSCNHSKHMVQTANNKTPVFVFAVLKNSITTKTYSDALQSCAALVRNNYSPKNTLKHTTNHRTWAEHDSIVVTFIVIVSRC